MGCSTWLHAAAHLTEVSEWHENLKAKGWVQSPAGDWSHPSRGRLPDRGNEAGGAKSERAVSDALAVTAQAQGASPGKFVVRVTSFRCNLLDEDNLVEKYHVDALRYAALLPGDSPGQATISVTQVKVATEEEEYTRIVITPL